MSTTQEKTAVLVQSGIQEKQGASPIICFSSARGGVGKSCIVALLAQIAHHFGQRVAVCDLDFSFSNLCEYFGLDLSYDKEQATEKLAVLDYSYIDSCAVSVNEHIDIYSSSLNDNFEACISSFGQAAIAKLASLYDVVLVDIPSAWNSAASQVLQVCDRLCIVIDDRAGALGSLVQMEKKAISYGVARSRIIRCLNRCDVYARDQTFLTRADMGGDSSQTMHVYDGGAEVVEFLSLGHIQELSFLENDFVVSLTQAYAKLLLELGVLPNTAEAKQAAADCATPYKSRGIFRFFRKTVR